MNSREILVSIALGGEAFSIMEEVASAVQKWRSVASEFGISKRECDRMSSAFVV